MLKNQFYNKVITIIEMKETEQESGTSFLEEYGSSKAIQIPLMSKKLNSVEKYVNTYRLNRKTQSVYDRQAKNSSKLSGNAQKLILGNKYINDTFEEDLKKKNSKCYVKYEPVSQIRTDEKLQQLDRIQMQYQNLKSNLSEKKTAFTSKFTLPLANRSLPRKSQTQMEVRFDMPRAQIEKQLRKQTLIEDGQKYFVDLYMMKKDRTEVKAQIQKNRKFTVKQEVFYEQQKQKQKYLISKKQKEAEEKKAKMLKNKGLHWNVYYQMMALSKNQKQRLKGSNSSFLNTYCQK